MSVVMLGFTLRLLLYNTNNNTSPIIVSWNNILAYYTVMLYHRIIHTVINSKSVFTIQLHNCFRKLVIWDFKL